MRSSRVTSASSNSSVEGSWDSSGSRLFSRGYRLRSVVGVSSGSACAIGLTSTPRAETLGPSCRER
jgi:hypothetical protein